MKKTQFAAATALMTVLLAGGFAQAATAPAVEPKPMHMMKGAMAPESKELREAMMKFHAEHKADFEKLQALVKEQSGIVKAPTFDKSAYLAKEGEIASLHQQIASARAEAMAEAFGKMSAEDRAKLPEGPMMGKRPMMRGPHAGGPMGAQPPAEEPKE